MGLTTGGECAVVLVFFALVCLRDARVYSSSFVLVETVWVGAGQAHGMSMGGGGDSLLQREGNVGLRTR